MKKRRNQVIMTIVLVISLIFGLSIYGSQTNKQDTEVQKPETSQQAQSSNQADGENEDESAEKNSKDSEDSDDSDDSDRENEEKGSEEETSKEAEEGSQTAERTESETSSPEQEEGAEETGPSESSGQEVQDGSAGNKPASRPAENRQAQSSGNSSQAGQGGPASEAVPQETVQVTITTGPVRGGILSRSVPYQEGDTALDVSLRAMQAAGISYSLSGAGATAYMSGIDGLYEFDEGPLSGWKISVNGSDIDRSSGAYPVSAGSQVTWYYTTNYLED